MGSIIDRKLQNKMIKMLLLIVWCVVLFYSVSCGRDFCKVQWKIHPPLQSSVKKGKWPKNDLTSLSFLQSSMKYFHQRSFLQSSVNFLANHRWTLIWLINQVFSRRENGPKYLVVGQVLWLYDPIHWRSQPQLFF